MISSPPTLAASQLVHLRHVCLLSHIGCFAIPWAVACQVSLSMGFSRQEHWSGVPFPCPRDLSKPGIEAASPALTGGFFTTEPPREPKDSSVVPLTPHSTYIIQLPSHTAPTRGAEDEWCFLLGPHDPLLLPFQVQGHRRGKSGHLKNLRSQGWGGQVSLRRPYPVLEPEFSTRRIESASPAIRSA